ncbi:hypothetical protein POTOM_055461 [Populus tomentosa]|uniref:Uncharacterized protein n=1 Tax=Populus tomentosa TaxID=118781 RepID=A0A8X7Y152_POPTO|nr:hypothetical protein POTOM_055461 [Populus tomentosa]
MLARYLVIVITVVLNLITFRISLLLFNANPFLFPVSLLQELRLCSHLISEFGSESSTMTPDGAFSSTRLKNPSKSMDSPLLSQENGSRDSMAFDE